MGMGGEENNEPTEEPLNNETGEEDVTEEPIIEQ